MEVLEAPEYNKQKRLDKVFLNIAKDPYIEHWDKPFKSKKEKEKYKDAVKDEKGIYFAKGDERTKIDTIITDLILPYAQPTALGPKDRFRDLITLLDSNKCNKIALIDADEFILDNLSDGAGRAAADQ